jgi:hypothetical protein
MQSQPASLGGCGVAGDEIAVLREVGLQQGGKTLTAAAAAVKGTALC